MRVSLPVHVTIIRLRLRGIPPRRIARITHLPRQRVYLVLGNAKRRGITFRRLSDTGRTELPVPLPGAVLDRLELSALERNVSTAALAREIICAAAPGAVVRERMKND